MRTFLTLLLGGLLLGGSTTPQAPARLKISRLTGDFYVFTTYGSYKGSPVPSNGLYVLTRQGAVLIDSPWDSTQRQPLLDSIRARHGQRVVLCLATHFHEDRTGGLAYYRQRGIRTYTTRQTDQLSRQHGMPRAEFRLNGDTTFTVGQYAFRTIYPGPGHAPDNIVVWFPKQRVLYGGCLVKSLADNSLGNLADADVARYATTIEQVQRQCPAPRYVVPGHNDWRSPRALEHTRQLALKLREQP